MLEQKVVILNHEYPDLDLERARLAAIGARIEEAHCVTEDETIAAAQDAAGIICIYAQLTERVLSGLNRCKVIARPGVGYDMIDVDAARARGISVTYVPDYCTEEVADHTVAMILALKRKLPLHHENIRLGKWDYKAAGRIRRLQEQTLGLVGLGRIARRVAAKLRQSVSNVIAYDPFVPDSAFRELQVHNVSLQELLKSSDIISLHCPSTVQTYHLISSASLALTEKQPVLVNTGRGRLVDTAAVIKALNSGQLSGAGLDVLESEPGVPPDLLQAHNLIVSPHAAWVAEENEREVRSRALDDLVRVFNGEPPRFPVPPLVGSSNRKSYND